MSTSPFFIGGVVQKTYILSFKPIPLPLSPIGHMSFFVMSTNIGFLKREILENSKKKFPTPKKLTFSSDKGFATPPPLSGCVRYFYFLGRLPEDDVGEQVCTEEEGGGVYFNI